MEILYLHVAFCSTVGTLNTTVFKNNMKNPEHKGHLLSSKSGNIMDLNEDHLKHNYSTKMFMLLLQIYTRPLLKGNSNRNHAVTTSSKTVMNCCLYKVAVIIIEKERCNVETTKSF